MAQKSQVLQAENAKLRHEIRSLQSALKDINRDQSPSYPGKVPNSNKKKEQSPLVSRQRREKLRREIEDKLDRGVFSPPKSPALSRNRSREDKTSEAQSIVKQSVSTDTMHFIASFGPSQIRETPISRENPYQTKESVRIETEEPSFEDSDYLNADKQSDYNNSISQELGQIKDTVDGLYASIESLDRDMLEESEKSLRNTWIKYEDEKSIKDSFDSYYSEEESKRQSRREHVKKDDLMAGNIKDNESSKQSFREELKLTSEKTNETSLIREIEALRQENSALRQKLASSSDNKSKRKALKQKKTSRNASITKESLTPKNTENSITLKRFASFQKTSPKGSRSPKLSENKHPAFKSLIPKSPSRTRVIPKSEDLMTTPKSGHKRNNSFTLKSPKLKTARSSSTHSLIYFPLNPSRSRHCPACDHLLSKGYSTKHCSKHGFATSKSPRSLSNRSGHDK